LKIDILGTFFPKSLDISHKIASLGYRRGCGVK